MVRLFSMQRQSMGKKGAESIFRLVPLFGPYFLALALKIQISDSLVLVVLQGSLSAHIKRKQSGVLSEYEAQWYTMQLLDGIEFLHVQNVIHRDIKGRNCVCFLDWKQLKGECPRRPRGFTKMWHMLQKLISLIFR